MRLMWLWVLLYALVAGFILLFGTISIGWGLGESSPTLTGIAHDIAEVAIGVAGFGTLGGFLVCLAGMILLLIRGTFAFAVGRAMSLIGIGLYYVAALGLVVFDALHITIHLVSPGEIVVLVLILAVIVALPGFFIMRTLRRAQKAENAENIET